MENKEHDLNAEGTVKTDEVAYLVVDVVLLDGKELLGYVVFKETDAFSKEYVSDAGQVNQMFQLYPWGNEVRRIYLQGVVSREQVVTTPNKVKSVKPYWVNAKGEVIKGAESVL